MTAHRFRRTLLMSTRWTGHRLHFLRLLATRSLQLGSPVTILLPRSVENTPEFAIHLNDLQDIDYLWLEDGDPATAVTRTLELAEPADHVVFPDGDATLRALGRWLAMNRPRSEISVLLIHVPYPTVKLGLLAASRLRAKAVLIHAIRARGVSVLQLTDSTGLGESHRLYKRLAQVPDPVPLVALPSRQEARARVGIEPDRFVVASLGVQRADKHPALLIDAWKRSTIHSRPDLEPALVLAGHQPDEVRPEIERRAKGVESIVIRDEHLSDDDLGAFVAASDAMALAIRGHGPSSMLSLAIQARTPLLVAGNPRLCRIVDTFSIGLSTSVDIGAIAQGFDQLRNLGTIDTWPDVATPDEFADAILAP